MDNAARPTGSNRSDGSSEGSGTAPGATIHVDVQIRVGSLELDVSFDTTTSRTAIVGPSGAGKSTLLRVLAGVEHRAHGRITVAGERWLDSEAGIRVSSWERQVGWVPQEALLFPHLSVRENLAYSGVASGSELRETARLVQADHLLDRRPAVLSGGERQRVALARALLARPALLLLDEPFSALDRPLRAELIQRLARELEARPVPLILVSHDPDDAEQLGCTSLHLVDGHLTEA